MRYMADDEGLLKTVVFIGTFAIMFTLLFAYASPLFSASSPPSSNSWITSNFEADDVATTNFWENDGNTSFNMTSDFEWDNYVTEPPMTNTRSGLATDGDEIEFTSDGQTVHVYPVSEIDVNAGLIIPVGNNIADGNSFLIYQQWGWWDHEWETITFDTIVNNIETSSKNVQSKIHIDLKGGMDVWFVFSVGANARALLELGYGFTIVIGQSLLDAAEASQNIWNVITGLLTFNIDTGNDILNVMVCLPITISVAYITLIIVSKLIPGLG
jgi:hypothetical protein